MSYKKVYNLDLGHKLPQNTTGLWYMERCWNFEYSIQLLFTVFSDKFEIDLWNKQLTMCLVLLNGVYKKINKINWRRLSLKIFKHKPLIYYKKESVTCTISVCDDLCTVIPNLTITYAWTQQPPPPTLVTSQGFNGNSYQTFFKRMEKYLFVFKENSHFKLN